MAGPGLHNGGSGSRGMLVWDAEGTPTAGDRTVVLWRGYRKAGDPEVVSLPSLVEGQAEELRARYLAWVYRLGETRIGGRRIIEHLELLPGLSYWWMASLAQKFNCSQGSQIDNAVKLLALEPLLKELKPVAVRLVTGNKELIPALRSLCGNLGIDYSHRYAAAADAPTQGALRRVYRELPAPVKAMVYFVRHAVRSRGFLAGRKGFPDVAPAGIAFVDVLVHLNEQAFRAGRFVSNYWTRLVDLLEAAGQKTVWIHNHYNQPKIPDLLRADALTRLFTKNSKGLETHILAESAMTWRTLFAALSAYLKIARAGLRLSGIRRLCRVPDSEIDFWPLFRREWHDSTAGHEAMVNSLRLALYERLFRLLPRQRIGVYLQENQSWELALVYFWRKAGHGRLIGVPHTTVRFWDLRYHYASQTYDGGRNALPTPDITAVNGPVNRRSCLEGGMPESRLADVEALRFLHLKSGRGNLFKVRRAGNGLTVLVCGDFLKSTNSRLFSWLAAIGPGLPPDVSFICKPHPANPVDTRELPSLTIELSDAPLPELFQRCDVMFASNITSAAVDAYCSGLPVIQMLDGATVNTSPLRGLSGVRCATDPAELADALRKVRPEVPLGTDAYFFLDEKLSRWQILLEV